MSISVIDPEPAEVPPFQRRPVADVLLEPSTIFVAGAITALVLVVMTALWIGFHAETWRNDWVCSASFTSSVAARRAISIGAAGSLGMLASTTLWLGWRRTGHRIVGSLFWLAVVASWLVCGAMLMTGSIDTCTGTAL